ncbi:uncharacterized protein VNE69_06110 [Vairimorpha necatrix]|uniref:Uncharacterized protein n=1 Tax=Vairimorpha necatrix TaxID=6039 RepID=A0AAX4JCV6_9MICR
MNVMYLVTLYITIINTSRYKSIGKENINIIVDKRTKIKIIRTKRFLKRYKKEKKEFAKISDAEIKSCSENISR